MLEVDYKKNCTGCSACANICPRGCIRMTADCEGFLYPEVNEEQCMDCGLCENVCPMLHKPKQHELVAVYGAKNRDDAVRFTSSSGGMFTLLAEEVLRQGGVVAGAALDEKLAVRHVLVDNVDDLFKLRGSKYVQSEIGTIYREVRQQLLAGKKVLFSGTPCQIAGLKGYLVKPFANLLTVDVVCHGVPSPRVYCKHLAELGEEAGEPVVQVRFRDKAKGWKSGETLFLTEHQRFGASKRQETYMRLFLNNISIRPSCGECAFNNKRSLADITIADYWGIDKQFPEFDDDKGVTLVLVNSRAGADLLALVKEQAELIVTDFAKGAEYNLAVSKSLPLHSQRAFFFEQLDAYTLKELVERCLE